ncbi:DUF4249 domain-containing protein [Bizionia gelidisalsuginis]|uniref:DUF4249 domain-containing protein n=1 Tax=Bizionia gelidisalsuginis TaxID=291188 RepID=A0ABY3M9S5_9FLAO|nr:DUF4249 domain-containing protein [Bizionia gelidisalsuginis]TYC12013.1 DUF4249 domain-containing protein [Bizionia gelidisalsuginis]
MKKHIIYKTVCLALVLSCFNCTEEIPLETEGFEDVLVVEATLTNEVKHQEVTLSRTYFIEGNSQVLENGANVSIVNTMGNTYNFSQNNEGIYISNTAFEALPNTNYTLYITTSSGKRYKSTEAQLTPISNIDELYAELTQEGPNADKVQVLVNSNNETTNAQYFRYEYIETHKIIVPYYSNLDAQVNNVVGDGLQYNIYTVPKTENKQTCYITNSSNTIIQTSTSDLNNNIVNKFPVRVIEKDNALLREQYSIDVKQYVQSFEAYQYYKIINDLGADESLLSESQPGFVVGNIKPMDNNSKRVIGYFDVSWVSSKRLFFNFNDVNITQPPYPYDCEYETDVYDPTFPYPFNYNVNHLKLDYTLTGGAGNPPVPNQRALLYNYLTKENYQYLEHEYPIYTLVSPVCGDCTSFSSSSNIQPDFWED